MILLLGFSKGVQRVEALRAQSIAIPRPRALRMPTKRPAQKDCRFKSSMPADGVTRCHSPQTETSARPVSKSSFKEDYMISRPPKRPSYWPMSHRQSGQNQSLRCSSWVIFDGFSGGCRLVDVRFSPKARRSQALARGVAFDHTIRLWLRDNEPHTLASSPARSCRG